MIIKQSAPVSFLFGIPICLCAVFPSDVTGFFEPIVSVLYLPLIAISTRAVSKAGVAYIGLICLVMTCAGFILSKVEGFELITDYQMAMLIAAIIVTTLASIFILAPEESDAQKAALPQ
jgi:hypothetical protein